MTWASWKKPLSRRAQLREKILGLAEHPNTLRDSLAAVLDDMGKQKEAAELCHKQFCLRPGWHGQIIVYPQETCLCLQ